MTSGIAFFAYNTEQIDYIRLATLAAHYARRAMPDLPICLITDSGTWEWFRRGKYFDLADRVFDEVVLTDLDNRVNKRTHWDSPYHSFASDFKNGNKHKIIKYSPYDKTLLLDIDYVLMNNNLEWVFDSDQAVVMFDQAQDLVGEAVPLPQQNLHQQGISMKWSTVVYFDRTQDTAQMFFDTWAHISDNYDFYKFLYGFPGTLYRTDYCVSIAAHILNGMAGGSVVGNFGQPLINMSQHDDIAGINQLDEWVYLVNDRKENWENSLTLIKDENVHVMNKRSLDRNFDTIMELFDE